MKNLSSWLIAMFAFMFWGYRVVEAVFYSLGKELVAPPLDMTMEIVLLFITFICMCFIAKRKLLPVAIYLVSHAFYYGFYLYQKVLLLIEGQPALGDYITLLVAIVGMIIPIAAFFDVLVDKNRKAHPVDKKTDWFYKDKKYDREMDERADRNQYRSL